MGGWGMKGVDTIARIRREHFVRGRSIKEIARELHVSRNTVRKVLRSGATEFAYARVLESVAGPLAYAGKGDLTGIGGEVRWSKKGDHTLVSVDLDGDATCEIAAAQAPGPHKRRLRAICQAIPPPLDSTLGKFQCSRFLRLSSSFASAILPRTEG